MKLFFLNSLAENSVIFSNKQLVKEPPENVESSINKQIISIEHLAPIKSRQSHLLNEIPNNDCIFKR